MREIAILALLALFALPAFAGEARFRHDLAVALDPAAHAIEVVDAVTRPAGDARSPLRFFLHAGLEVSSATPGVTVEAAAGEPAAADFGAAPEDFPAKAGVPRRVWVVRFAQGTPPPATFALKYKGAIHHPIRELAAEYARGFSETPGLVEERGAFLCGATWWTPWFDDRLFTFSLTVSLPETWDAVSQGTRTRHETAGGRRWTRWDCKEPMEEVYLCAAAFTGYAKSAGAVEVMAFLRTPDENLANTYLETTAQYLEMYRGLVGPFPFAKFALVENFWQTGYGMPSFTLLGDQIIRFPFILHSS
ncbi:MAG: peptidase M28, partial [Planctomycetes bacterium]|nr:peptidase M28 [Planctomycetota bacterium]